MAKFPDYTAVGERRLPIGQGRESVDRSAEIAAAGIAQSASGAVQVIDRLQRNVDDFDLGRAQTAFHAGQADVQASLENEHWSSVESKYDDGIKKARETAGSLIRNPNARAIFEQRAELDSIRGRQQAMALAKQKEGDWGRGELRQALESSYKSALETDDEMTRQSIAESVSKTLRGAVESGYIDEERATIESQTWSRRYGEGYVDVLPNDAEKLKVLRKPKGTPADFIDPAKRAEMIDRLEERARVRSDRREAKAERAIAQIERQIASGVPATDAMWKSWRADIAGTSVQGQLDELLAGEREVQDILKKPIAEQMRLVQEKDAALKASGGTVAQAANVERLRQAVTKNITTLQTNPLLYAEARHDDKASPLNMNGLIASDQLPDLAAGIQERADTIRGLRRSVGAEVPMRPLLPQEAAQLSRVLDKASPAEASELFASLHAASGATDVFRGVMQQIAPDSPVKAAAGMLAAKDAELNAGDGWFQRDNFLRSRDVAATILRGEALLNPTKGDKTEDGKSKTSKLLLPSAAQADLQLQFARQVGDAFAGREHAADTAYQAVLAYYVGKAAEKGALASDSQTADTDIVREAVRATLGNVVNFNGNRRVLAPWGMASDDFEDRAERALAARMKELGVADRVDIDDLALTNGLSDGEYAVMMGENLLLDPDGNPIVIDLKPSDRRGFIDRSRK